MKLKICKSTEKKCIQAIPQRLLFAKEGADY
jgi:hypothetical protein